MAILSNIQTLHVSTSFMNKASGKGDSLQRLALLKATEPELLEALHKIDLAKKALRRQSATGLSLVPVLVVSCSASSSSERTVGYESTVERPRPQHITVAGTQMVKPGELPRFQRTHSTTRMLQLRKAQDQTPLSRGPLPKPDQTAEQKQQQLFLNRRAALYRPLPPKSSDAPVSDYTQTIRLRRHRVVDIAVSEPELPLRLKQKEVHVPRTRKYRNHFAACSKVSL